MANTFIELNDVPSDYANAEGTFLVVNDTGDGVEFVNLVGTPGILTVTPSNGNVVLNITGTGVTAGVYGNTSHFPRITVDSYGRIENVTLEEITDMSGFVDANGNVDLSQVTTDAFRDITVAGMSPPQTTLSADGKHDILNLIAGTGISIITNAANDSITFSSNVDSVAAAINIANLQGVSTVGIQNGDLLVWNANTNQLEPGSLDLGGNLLYTAGAGISINNLEIALTNTAVTPGTYGSAIRSPVITIDAQGRVTSATQVDLQIDVNRVSSTERFRVAYNGSGQLSSADNLTAGIASVTVNSSGDTEITLAGTYNYPPASITFYGYDYANDKYIIVPMDSSVGLREVGADAFTGNGTIVIKLRLREAETGASRGEFGTTTHAWVQMVM